MSQLEYDDAKRLNDIWDSIEYGEVIANVPQGDGLPEENRGGWYCPVGDQGHVLGIMEIAEASDYDTIYDLGAGDLRVAASLDALGFDVVAYETLESVTDYALEKLPENSVEVRNRDYYAEWGELKEERAVFVALGRMNVVPGRPERGMVIDGWS